MIKQRLYNYLSTSLPSYVTGTLSPVAAFLVRAWLKHSAEARAEVARLRQVQSVIRRRSLSTPSPVVLQRIRAEIQQLPAPAVAPTGHSWLAWAGGMLMIVMAFVLLWQTLPPGIVLEWSLQGAESPTAFRVYRAPADLDAGGRNFVLVEELPASPATADYTFTDLRLLPGQDYVYRVEALSDNGELAQSRTVVGHGEDALPGQLGLLLTLAIAGYGLALLLREWRPLLTRRSLQLR